MKQGQGEQGQQGQGGQEQGGQQEQKGQGEQEQGGQQEQKGQGGQEQGERQEQGQQEQGEEQKEQQEEQQEFERLLQQIGGRKQIYLVGDAEGPGVLFQEFIVDMFDTRVEIGSENLASFSDVDVKTCGGSARGANVDRRAGEVRVTTVTQNGHSGHRTRTIHSTVIIFIFRHSFVHNKANAVCMEEIMKDVRIRMKKARGVRQAVLGLVHANAEGPDTAESLVRLMDALRLVFVDRPRDSVWAGHFIPKSTESTRNIKRNFCRVVHASQDSDDYPSRKRCIFWPPRRWFRPERREGRPGTGAGSSSQKASSEEGIPLQIRSESQS